MTDDPTPTGDDMLRDLANNAQASRRQLLHRVTTSSNIPPTATHYPRRHLLARLRDEWQQQHPDTHPNERNDHA
jgi:hypothetical protein